MEKALIAIALVISFVLGSPLFIPPPLPALASPSTNCDSQVDAQVSTLQSTLNTSAATSLAQTAPGLLVVSAGYITTYGTLFNEWSWDVNCVVTWTSVNVVFALSNASGFAEYAIVTESPNLQAITSVTLQHPPVLAYGHKSSSLDWSGYQTMGDAFNETAIWETVGDWKVPTVSIPSSPPSSCQSKDCDLAVWIGLSNDEKGSYIAQTGTTGSIHYCGTGCWGYSYYAWMELYPSPSVQCSFYMTSGDSIHAYVMNHAANPGGDKTKYDLQLNDNTQHHGCSFPNQSFGQLGTPYFGEFIAERPCLSGSCTQDSNFAQLPSFTTYTTSGSTWYNGGLTGLYTIYSKGFYNQITMRHTTSSPPAIIVSAIGSSSSFTQQFSYSW